MTARLFAVGFLCGVMVAADVRGGESDAYFRQRFGVAANDSASLPDDVESDDVIMWRAALGPGHSSPCVCGDRIFLTMWTPGSNKLETVALSRDDGRVLWSQVAPNDRLESYHPTGSPAVSTVACDGKRVFSFFGSYGLLCYDLDGKPLWSAPMGPFQDEFGAGSSPIVVAGRVLVNQDHDKDNFLVCLDAATGKPVWRTIRDGTTRSYATPVVCEVNGKKVVVISGALQMRAYDFETGKELWTVDGLARIVNTTPAIAGDMLYVSTWSPGGDTDARIAMEPWATAIGNWDANKDEKLTREECNNPEVLDRFYRIDLNQDKHLDEAEWIKYARVFELARNSVMALRMTEADASPPSLAWRQEKNIPYVPSPLVYRDVLYLIKDGGILTTFDARDGRIHKVGRVRGAGKFLASPVAGDGKVYLVNEEGVLTVIKAGAEWDAISSRDFGERTIATPALVDGRIYLRTEQFVYCLGRKP